MKILKKVLPIKCSNGTPMCFSCLVTSGVGIVASSITNQNKFGICFSVCPNLVISANCSARLYVGVIMYKGGGKGYKIIINMHKIINK